MTPASTAPPCIYCQTRPTGSREDLLPRALGRFPRTAEWRRRDVLCGVCNNSYTGELYDRLFRRGPYSIDRVMLTSGIGRSAEEKKRSRGPSYDLPFTWLPGWEGPALVEMAQGGERGNLPLQVLLQHPEEDPIPWAIPIDVLQGEVSLGTALARSHHDGATLLRYVDDEAGTAASVLARMSANLRMTPVSGIEPGDLLTAARGWRIEPVHVRAVTMLTFHLFLALSGKRGADAGFRAVREVVQGKGDPWSVTCNWLARDPDRPAVPVRDERPDVPKHLYTCHVNEQQEVVARLRLFAHLPEKDRPWWTTRLGRADLEPQGMFGLALCYLDEPVVRDGTRIVGEEVGLRVDGDDLVIPRASGRSC